MRISEYVLIETIGIGSFGEVWKAHHHVWKDDFVAVKLPTEPEYVRYLQREGIVVHGLRHPNIVRVLGLDPYGDQPYLIMELVDGPSLRQVVDENPDGLPIAIVHTILQGLLQAMQQAHENGVLHRDLKPGNVLLHLDGKPLESLTVENVKVTDFGLGVGTGDMLRSIAQSASIDRDNRLVGTLAYMGSEVRDGGQQPDAKSDLYAIGVMLFEMLTGERPGGAELPSTIRSETAHMDHVFQKLYARHERRFESAAEVLAAIPTNDSDRPKQSTANTSQNSAAQTYLPKCSACGGATEPNDQFCTHCGVQLVERIRRCPSCNAYPAPEDQFCIFCGASLLG